jgi:hypothetical protein
MKMNNEQKEAEEKRQANILHRSSVINTAAAALNNLIPDYNLCEEIIGAIAEGKIDHVKIDF